ncbi:hypothetical protein WDU94_014861 [Cyamophila willieti]
MLSTANKQSFASAVKPKSSRYGSAGSYKSAAPVAFSSTFSRASNSKESSDDLLLPLECAFSLPYDDTVYQNITYGGKSGTKFVMHLSSKEKLKHFVALNQSITIDEKLFPINKLVDPGFLIILHNVVPHIPNFAIEDELRKTLRLKSPILLSKCGMRDPRLSHILAYKREVYIASEDKDTVRVFINVSWKSIVYKIHVSFDSSHSMRCFQCGKEGHLSKNCSDAPAQRRLDHFNAIAAPTQGTEADAGTFLPSQDIQSVSPDLFPTFTNKSLHSINMKNSGSQSCIDLTADKFPALPPVTQNEMLPPPPPPPPLAPATIRETRSKRNGPSSDSSQDERKKKKNAALEDESSIAFKTSVEEILSKPEYQALPVSCDDMMYIFKITKNKTSDQRQKGLTKSNKDLSAVRHILQHLIIFPGVAPNMKRRAIAIENSIYLLFSTDDDEDPANENAALSDSSMT